MLLQHLQIRADSPTASVYFLARIALPRDLEAREFGTRNSPKQKRNIRNYTLKSETLGPKSYTLNGQLCAEQ